MKKLFLSLLFPCLVLAQNLKVVSYNVQNLFDLVHDGGEYGEFIPERHNWTQHTLTIKLDHIADVLCDIDGDIVALQEIENQNALDLLTQKLKSVGCPYPYTALTHNPDSTIQNALISRLPILTRRDHPIRLKSKERPILEVAVKVGEGRLVLFINHWKSKSKHTPESRRIASAKVLAQRLESLPKGSEYILMGDFNSNYDEYRTIEPKLDDTQGVTGINHILHTLKEGELVTKEQLTYDGGFHSNLWLELVDSDRWSYKHFGERSTIDSILIPHSMRDGKGVEYLDGSFGVFRPDYLFTKEGWILGWQYKSSKHLGKGYSDHLPIFATFTTESTTHKADPIPSVGSIDSLYGIDKLTAPMMLKNAVVILRRGKDAIIKHSPTSRAITIHKAPKELQEGRRYDLLIDEIADYKGLKEITSIRSVKEIGVVDIDRYILSVEQFTPNNLRLQNEVFRDIVGIFRDGKLYVGENVIPIHFKKRNIVPPEGAKLKIFYGQLGYYRGVQLVVHERGDFKEER